MTFLFLYSPMRDIFTSVTYRTSLFFSPFLSPTSPTSSHSFPLLHFSFRVSFPSSLLLSFLLNFLPIFLLFPCSFSLPTFYISLSLPTFYISLSLLSSILPSISPPISFFFLPVYSSFLFPLLFFPSFSQFSPISPLLFSFHLHSPPHSHIIFILSPSFSFSHLILSPLLFSLPLFPLFILFFFSPLFLFLPPLYPTSFCHLFFSLYSFFSLFILLFFPFNSPLLLFSSSVLLFL